jgi:hypothetical protein
VKYLSFHNFVHFFGQIFGKNTKHLQQNNFKIIIIILNFGFWVMGGMMQKFATQNKFLNKRWCRRLV